jgi:HD superfamily phosphodiesterase
MAYGASMTLVLWASRHAAELLAPLGDRWGHTQGVVRQAEAVSGMLVAGDQEQLVAAAYVHDVGYAPTVKSTGLHALDGARHLRSLATNARPRAHRARQRAEDGVVVGRFVCWRR